MNRYLLVPTAFQCKQDGPQSNMKTNVKSVHPNVSILSVDQCDRVHLNQNKMQNPLLSRMSMERIVVSIISYIVKKMPLKVGAFAQEHQCLEQHSPHGLHSKTLL